MTDHLGSTFSVKKAFVSLVCLALVLGNQSNYAWAAPVGGHANGDLAAAPRVTETQALNVDVGSGRRATKVHKPKVVHYKAHDGVRFPHRGNGMMRKSRRRHEEPTWEPYTGTILMPQTSEDTETVTKTKKGKKTTVTQMRTTTNVITETKSAKPSHWTSTATIAATFTLHGEDGENIVIDGLNGGRNGNNGHAPTKTVKTKGITTSPVIATSTSKPRETSNSG